MKAIDPGIVLFIRVIFRGRKITMFSKFTFYGSEATEAVSDYGRRNEGW